MTTIRKCLSVLLIGVVSAIYCSADANGKISGSVTDTSGATIPSAIVSAREVGTNVEHVARTDSQGNYSLLALPPGQYDLQIQSTGFKTYEQAGIKVDVSSALRINVVMQVGSVQAKVEVSSQAVRVETSNTQVSNVIGGQMMENIPLNGRSYTDLMGLQPGVTPAHIYSSTGGARDGSADTGSLSINGQKENSNGFLVNGGNVENSRNNGAAIVPNLDSISEFRVITSNVDPEYGHYNGGLISVVTKSGTNTLHGSAFEFLRNTDLDARNFFLPQRGVFRRNQFGGTLGGPVKRDKLFFFIDYQGTRQLQEVSQGRVPLPTLANRGGDFSATAASSLIGIVGGPYWAGVLSQRLGYAVANGEAYFTPGCVSSAQCVFPNGIIPQSAFDPAAKGLLPQIPSPNQVINGLGYFVAQGGSANNFDSQANQGGVRIDYNTSRWGTISGYYSITPSTLTKPFGANPVPGSPSSDNIQAQQLTISNTKSFGANAVNEFRVNVLRLSAQYDYPKNVGPSLSALGFVTPWSASTGGITQSDPSAPGSPNLLFSNFSVGVPNISYATYQTNPQVIDNFSKVVGSHTLKMGVEYQPSHFAQTLQVQDTFTFTGGETGSDFADFLIGAPITLLQTSLQSYNGHKGYWGVYGQDSWKVRRTLTVNYGLRWDWVQNWSDRKTGYTKVLGEQSVVYPSAPLGTVFAGDPSPLGGKIPLTVERTPLNNFAPRIGIAYSPRSGKTSIRAAYGLFYGNNEGEQIYSATGGVPFTAVWTSSTPPLLFEPYRHRVDGLVDQSPPFPSYIPPPPGATVYKGCPTCPVGPINWEIPITGNFAWSIYNVTPYAENYHVTIQRQFDAATVLSIGYVGTQGHHLQVGQAQNPGDSNLCLSLSQPSQVAPGTPTCGPNGENTVYTRADGTIVNGTRAPYGSNYGENSFMATIGNSHYNAFQVSLQHSSKSISLLAAYTLSKSIDQAAGLNVNVINPFNNKLSYGLSQFDIPQSFVLSYSYMLPFDRFLGSNRPRLTGGWRLAGITRFANGTPIMMYETDDRSLLGLGIGAADAPIYNGAALNFKDPRSNQPYFNVAEFSTEPLGVLNTRNRAFFHGPGMNNFDMSLLKDTKINERFGVEFRAEFFNVFNHAQFLNCNPGGAFLCPIGNVNGGSFGMINTARDPRIGQLALKLFF
jgi:hypothetical protein